MGDNSSRSLLEIRLKSALATGWQLITKTCTRTKSWLIENQRWFRIIRESCSFGFNKDWYLKATLIVENPSATKFRQKSAAISHLEFAKSSGMVRLDRRIIAAYLAFKIAKRRDLSRRTCSSHIQRFHSSRKSFTFNYEHLLSRVFRIRVDKPSTAFESASSRKRKCERFIEYYC